MTNFKRKTSFDPDNLEEVLNGFKEEGYEVFVVGPDIYSKENDSEDTALARQFVEATDGATSTLDSIMKHELLFHRKKIVNASPWNVDLSIGPNIKIPVSTFIKLRDEPVVKTWKKAVKDPVTSTASTFEAVEKRKEYINPENQSTVKIQDKIQGYHYGQTIIPFTDLDKTMLYQPGEKCLSVYGFTHADNISWQNLTGDGLSYVFARKGDKNAQKAIRCLVECLHELNLVGIVRKVHNNNNAPKMFALMPVIDTNNYVCLSMIALSYKEEIKQMSFPATNLKKYSCTPEQVNAFKDLINAMDLTQAYDDTYDDKEAFPIAECISPAAQYVLDCIAFRALNPGKPLPKPREEVMSLFQVPPLLEENARKPIEKIKSLFTLNKVEVKKRKNKNVVLDIDQIQAPLGDFQPDTTDIPNMPKVQLPINENEVDNIHKISTINPVEDFKVLQGKNKPLSELAPGMIKAIESLIYNNIDGNYTKALDAMKHLRSEFLKSDPKDYNDWMRKFKSDLAKCDNNQVLCLIMEKQVSFYTEGRK
ncbi:X-ray repair cross-complementing protein 5-like [Trichoplusia ni]|uniref:X-ray repair cross-complementing protein 5-like n=1 Tax=Trichoplusia ni TaxID=7111 RepID=A0A7E5VBF0_TRINI|nr:X-ray repair cross-complementing protein 5-like [Trichoplusia ni]